MINYTAAYTDLYQISMGEVYFHQQQHEEKAVFDYFFRKLPFKGGYAVFAGLHNLLHVIENLRFEEDELRFLEKNGFSAAYLDYLAGFKFSGNIYSVQEGEVVFPVMPVLQVEANIIEAQIIESLLLNMLNFQTLIATKASRIRQVAGDAVLVDFGMRRAQGSGAYEACRAAIVGGFNATSNVLAGKDFDLPVSGTMAHSFVQSYDSELEAFRAFAKIRSHDCVLLVDTYDTLKSGVPNAITVAKEMQASGKQLKAIRLDSGDLAYLSRESRKMLDDAGLQDVKIAASNQLDEFVIKSLNEQDAAIDIYGVGTSLITGKPDAALDGVYKLSYANRKPRIKLSETFSKTTLPHRKQVFRISNRNNEWIGADAIALEHESELTKMFDPYDTNRSLTFSTCKLHPILEKVMENGKPTSTAPPLSRIADYASERLKKLPPEYKRFENPHVYKIGISKKLQDERNLLIEKYRKL